MDRPVLFLDSGIGGLPYLRHFLSGNPSRPVIYAADRANFPYGPRDRDELGALLTALVARLIEAYYPCLAVLACNTASVSALALLRERFSGIPWVGTVPAVKPAVTESRTRRVGVLGTQRTVEDPYIAELAARYGGDCAISGIAAPELVTFVERGGDRADAGEQRRTVEPYIAGFRRRGVDGIVLGCTHFLLLLDSFIAAAAPDIRIYDSVAGVSRRAEALLPAVPDAPAASDLPNLLVLTGEAPPEPRWFERAGDFGLTLRLLDAPEGGGGDRAVGDGGVRGGAGGGR
jgi:glutamate racemase